MATLTNPINKQNIVDRFADYVVADANGSIVWGTNSKPFSEMPNSEFGGTTSGRGISINGNSITGSTITASIIRSVLEAETTTYTNMRNMRARLNVTGGGGNAGSRPTAGIIYDQTRKAHLATARRSTVSGTANAGVTTGTVASVSNLQAFFTNLRTAYRAKETSAYTKTVSVCHANCHHNCHSNRGRR